MRLKTLTRTAAVAAALAGGVLAPAAAQAATVPNNNVSLRVAPVVEGSSGGVTYAPVVVEVAKPMPADGYVTVTAGDPRDTATAGSDYRFYSTNVRLPRGSTSGRFLISVMADATPEQDEEVILRVTGMSSGLTQPFKAQSMPTSLLIRNDDVPEAPTALRVVGGTWDAPIVSGRGVPGTTVQLFSDYDANPCSRLNAKDRDVVVQGDGTFTAAVSNPTRGAIYRIGAQTVVNGVASSCTEITHQT